MQSLSSRQFSLTQPPRNEETTTSHEKVIKPTWTLIDVPDYHYNMAIILGETVAGQPGSEPLMMAI